MSISINKKWIANHIATITGVTLAVLDAYQNIDWDNFDFSKEWMRLIVDAGIAIGGYLSKFGLISDAKASK